MKRINTGTIDFIILIAILLLVWMLAGCGGSQTVETTPVIEEVKEPEPEKLEVLWVRDAWDVVWYEMAVVKVKDCEYVVLNDGDFVELQHYADCSNPNHRLINNVDN